MKHMLLPFVFVLFIGFVLLQFFTVFRISKLPDEHHKYKRFWIRIVVRFPLFGALFYYYESYIMKMDYSDLPESYNSVSDRIVRRRKKI